MIPSVTSEENREERGPIDERETRDFLAGGDATIAAASYRTLCHMKNI